MTEDCNFGHARTDIVLQSSQGACCDRKAYHYLEKRHMYKSDTPLALVAGAVPRTYKPWAPGDDFCGLRTCETDATEWDQDCEVSICVEAKNLIAKTVCWPEGTTDDDVEAIRANKDCCFELIGAPCCHDPKLPDCEEATEGAK